MLRTTCVLESIAGTENVSVLSPADCPMASTSQSSLVATEIFRCQVALEDIERR